jgi:hypothetical protein
VSEAERGGRLDRVPRLAATSKGKVVFRVELVDGLVVGRGFGLIGQWLGHMVLLVQGRVDATLSMGRSNESVIGMIGIGTLVDWEGVIPGLGKRVNFCTPAIATVSPARDRLTELGGPVQVCE